MLPDEYFLRTVRRDGPDPNLAPLPVSRLRASLAAATSPEHRIEVACDLLLDQTCRIHDSVEVADALARRGLPPAGRLARALHVRSAQHGSIAVRSTLAAWLALGPTEPWSETLHARVRRSFGDVASHELASLRAASFGVWDLTTRGSRVVARSIEPGPPRAYDVRRLVAAGRRVEDVVAAWAVPLEDSAACVLVGAMPLTTRARAALRARLRGRPGDPHRDAWEALHLVISPRSPLHVLDTLEGPFLSSSPPEAPVRGAPAHPTPATTARPSSTVACGSAEPRSAPRTAEPPPEPEVPADFDELASLLEAWADERDS